MFALSAFGQHGHLLRANLYITYCFEQGKPGEGDLEPGQLGEGNSEGAHGARHGRGDDNDDLFSEFNYDPVESDGGGALEHFCLVFLV